MAEITAHYRRVIQIRPYETETIELGITDTVEGKLTAEALAGCVLGLHQELAKVGDAIVLERLDRAPRTTVAERAQRIAASGAGVDPWR